MRSITDEPFSGSKKTHQTLKAILTTSTFNALLSNRVPVSVADKLTKQIIEKADFSAFYDIVAQDIQDNRRPKQRVLDRTIVHMFEILYKIIYSEDEQKLSQPKEFFAIVPRGECLDLFLQLVKEYCMGDAEIKSYTYKILPLIDQHKKDGNINWHKLYRSNDFKKYLSGLLNLILTHLHEDQKPIPALENKIPHHYQPNRINSFLTRICKLRQTGLISLYPEQITT